MSKRSAVFLLVPLMAIGAPLSAQEKPGLPASDLSKADPALRKAVEVGDAWRVRSLVVRGADVEPFADADELVMKSWELPPGKNDTAPAVKIEMPRHVKRGEEIPIHIEFRNTSDTTEFYNSKFDKLISAPGGILLYDERKRCLGDLFDFDAWSGSRKRNGNGRDTIGRNEVLKRDDEFRLATNERQFASDPVHRTKAGDDLMGRDASFPPGRYYIQFVFWLRFAAPFYDGPNDPDAYYRNAIWLIPLYRSNLVAIDVE